MTFFFFFLNLFLCSSGSEGCEDEPDPASRFWNELSHVGLPEDLNVQSLFESGVANGLSLFLHPIFNSNYLYLES